MLFTSRNKTGAAYLIPPFYGRTPSMDRRGSHALQLGDNEARRAPWLVGRHFGGPAMRVAAKGFATAFVLFLTGQVQASDKESLALLDRAIKAHGGEAKMAKTSICRRTETGVIFRTDGDLKFTADLLRNLPGQIRLKLSVGKTAQFLNVINGDKGWVQAGGPTEELIKGRLQEFREEAYVWWLTTLVPLKKSAFTLTKLPEIKIDGEPAVGFKVTHKGYLDSNVYFLKRSNLLVQVSRRAPEAGIQVNKVYSYSGFKEFDGAKLPTKELLSLNGKKWQEITVKDYKFLAKIDPKSFARP
jgi:hypothetical protein